MSAQDNTLKIALISHLFPTELYPFHGKFIKDQLTLLNSDGDITADLYVPTPHSIPLSSRHRKNTSKLLSDDLKAVRVPYLSFPKKRFPEVIARGLSNVLEKQLQQQNYDTIHVHWLYPDGLCIPRLKKVGFKCVLTVHGSDWYQTIDVPELMKLLEETLKAADRVLYSGPLLRDDMEERFPWLKKKSEVIYNLVDADFYQMPTSKEKAEAIDALSWKKEKINVLTVSNLRHEKGVDLLLDAIDHEVFSEIDFHIIGARQKDEYDAKIAEQIRNSSHRNVLLHKPVPPNELLRYYHAANFFVLPSRREGFNVSILEAMSTGLPVVATPVGGNSEIIKKENGIVVDDISMEAIRKGIIEMKDRRENYDPAMIRTFVEKEFGKAAFLKRLVENYR